MCLGMRPEYDLVAAGAGPQGSAGAVPLGQCSFREQAHVQRGACFRGYCDFSCFFMSICRDVQHAVERKIGVRPEVTVSDVTFALQAATLMRYDTGAGLTEGVIGARGVGQGTVDGPRRSTLLLAQMQRAMDQLCAGFSHSAHCRAEGLRVLRASSSPTMEASAPTRSRYVRDAAASV